MPGAPAPNLQNSCRARWAGGVSLLMPVKLHSPTYCLLSVSRDGSSEPCHQTWQYAGPNPSQVVGSFVHEAVWRLGPLVEGGTSDGTPAVPQKIRESAICSWSLRLGKTFDASLAIDPFPHEPL